MYCRKCGAENKETSRFCSHCGTALPASDLGKETHQKLSRPGSVPEANPPPSPKAFNEAPQNFPKEAGSTKQDHGARYGLNPFSGFYLSRTNTSVLPKLMISAFGIATIIGLAGSLIFYFGHHDTEISELAKPPHPSQIQHPSKAPEKDVVFPCPAEMPFCIGAAASKIKDPSCTADKPVWAHYSDDDGITWRRAGCYATEAEARQGLGDALGIATPDLRKSETADLPTKPEKSDNHSSHRHAEASHAAEGDKSPKEYRANFKGVFGIIVERRTYPTAEMKKKALELWKSEQKILEPDGSINDKYAYHPPSNSGPIPGH